MAETNSGTRPSMKSLILVPAIITLAVTLLRLVGELEHWSPLLFNRNAGGGGALVGIAWLPIIFGTYFALKLSSSGEGPASAGKSIGFVVVAIAVFVLGGFLAFAPQVKFPGKMLVGIVLIAASAVIPLSGWSALGKVLLAYAFAARIPVVLLMFFAMRGSWGTHYDALPPEQPVPATFGAQYIQFAVVPQLVFWIAYTVILGGLFGSVVTAIARRGKTAAQGAS